MKVSNENLKKLLELRSLKLKVFAKKQSKKKTKTNKKKDVFKSKEIKQFSTKVMHSKVAEITFVLIIFVISNNKDAIPIFLIFFNMRARHIFFQKISIQMQQQNLKN